MKGGEDTWRSDVEVSEDGGAQGVAVAVSAEVAE